MCGALRWLCLQHVTGSIFVKYSQSCMFCNSPTVSVQYSQECMFCNSPMISVKYSQECMFCNSPMVSVKYSQGCMFCNSPMVSVKYSQECMFCNSPMVSVKWSQECMFCNSPMVNVKYIQGCMFCNSLTTYFRCCHLAATTVRCFSSQPSLVRREVAHVTGLASTPAQPAPRYFALRGVSRFTRTSIAASTSTHVLIVPKASPPAPICVRISSSNTRM